MIKQLQKITPMTFNKNPIVPILKIDSIFKVAIFLILLSSLYWLFIASDRYISESHVIIQKTDISGGQSVDFSSILSVAGGANHADQLLLRDYLLSIDMLKKLDAKLNLGKHYSDHQYDIFSRMWLSQPSIEQLYQYYLSRVEVQYDDYAGVLIIKADAYEPKLAHAIVTMLVAEGERYMNQLAHELAQNQVEFLETQVAKNSERALEARQAVLNYQNKKGLVSPQSTTENLMGLVAKLEAQKTELETQRSVLQSYLVPSHPNVILLNQQIAAVTKQISEEQAKLASPSGKTLNRTVEEYQRLEMEAGFTNDVYKTTLVALEKVRVDVARTIKKVSVLQAPSYPEYPLQPRRFYNVLVTALYIFLLAGLLHLMLAIIRDHKD